MATSDEFVLCSLPNKRPSSSSKPYFDYLPIELLIDIIQRLPQDVVHRCLCISKRWKKIISSDDFIKSYIQYNTCLANSRPPFALFFNDLRINNFGFGRCELGELQFAFSENKAIFKRSGFDFDFLPFDRSAPKINVLSSSNGLVLCSPFSDFPFSREKPVYYVCNPLTKKLFRLKRESYFDGLFTWYSKPVGFLSKSTSSGCSFRVILVFHKDIFDKYLIFQIYNSELRQWSQLVFDKILYDCYFSETSSVTFDGEAVACNGLLHWMNEQGGIFVYDPYCGTNEYVIISLPNKRYFGTTKPMIGECKGRLRYLEKCLEKYVVWELEDYDMGKWSLVEEFCLDKMDIKCYGSNHRDSLPIAFHPFDEDIVFLKFLCPGWIVSCNLRKNKLLTVCKINGGRKVSVFPIILPWWPVRLSQN